MDKLIVLLDDVVSDMYEQIVLCCFISKAVTSLNVILSLAVTEFQCKNITNLGYVRIYTIHVQHHGFILKQIFIKKMKIFNG